MFAIVYQDEFQCTPRANAPAGGRKLPHEILSAARRAQASEQSHILSIVRIGVPRGPSVRAGIGMMEMKQYLLRSARHSATTEQCCLVHPRVIFAAPAKKSFRDASMVLQKFR